MERAITEPNEIQFNSLPNLINSAEVAFLHLKCFQLRQTTQILLFSFSRS